MNKRHVIKALTWRILGTLDTLILSCFLEVGLNISIIFICIEVFTKSILYYFHEAFWFNSKVTNANIRHLIKPFTWRLIALVDTLLLSIIIFNNYSKAINFTFMEILTKITLYYIHDKLWYRTKYGINE